MKKAALLFFLAFIDLALIAQTKNISFDEYIQKSQPVEKQISESFSKGALNDAEKYAREAIALFDQLSKEDVDMYKSRQAGNYYNLACALSRQSKKKDAVDAFEKSVMDWGYTNYLHTLEDTDLDNIRKEKRFTDLVASLREKGDYVYILQHAGKYAAADTANLPHFDYEYALNGRLQDVRKLFKLDSVAGNGDEISKIINIMKWVHNNIRHDGNNWALCEFDAVDFYNYYKATGKGVNCRAMAITLNECYLSMGFKSRFITCLPKDENDGDCHVINCVYSKSLNKWIWMDPTFNAYVKDENGNFLGIEEVRDRLVNGKQLVLNDDANWNNQNKQTKEDYLYTYMAKNLYWLQCPLNSYFNIESRYRNGNTKYISLRPTGYQRSGTSLNETIVNDPGYFWREPK